MFALFSFSAVRKFGLWYLAYEAASFVAIILYAGYSAGLVTAGL